MCAPSQFLEFHNIVDNGITVWGIAFVKRPTLAFSLATGRVLPITGVRYIVHRWEENHFTRIVLQTDTEYVTACTGASNGRGRVDLSFPSGTFPHHRVQVL